MKKHLIIIGVVTFLLLIMQPTKPVKAETVGDFIVTGGILDTDYSYDSVNYILKVMTGEPIDIKNINPEIPTDNRIEVVVGNVANITLSGVNIKALMSPFVIQETATLNLILAEGTTNNLIGDSYDPTGLVVKASASLTIGGTGTLKAAGVFNGSGIGGEKYEKNGDITINSGTIIAIGIRGAGIGSGGNNIIGGSNTNGNIKINGGTILAYSKLGAGIGTGFGSGQGTPGAIEINGGKVTAIGIYYNGANSGIGNGVGSTVCGQVTISKEASIIAIGSGRSYGAITAPLGTGSTANILEAEFTNYIYSGCMFDVRDSSGVTSVTNYTFNNNPLDNSYINEGRSIAISVPDAGNYTLYKDNEKQQGTKDTIKSDLFHVATGLNLWKSVSNPYTVTWKSQDGATTLETDSSVEYGDTVSYDGEVPTKAADVQYTYTFTGWATSANAESGTIAGSLPTVSGDTTYYATFSKRIRSYSVTWKSQDGAITLETDNSVNYGMAPTYDGTTPTKAADAQYTYTFAGWATTANAESGTAAGSLPTISGDTTYYAAFSKTVKNYSVIWKSQDGATTLETDSNVNNGTEPSYDGTTPTKAADAQYTYTFAGWATSANTQSGTIAGSLPKVSGDTTYYAAFSKTVRSYSVIWKSQDGATTLEEDASVNYGTAPTYDGTTPTKAADAQYTYTFAGWATSANAQSGTAAVSLPTVSGNTTYYAAFSKTLRSYSVTWKSQDGVTTLETDNSVNYGTAPSYNGKAPTKAADAQYTYTFAGWATSANAESGTIAGSLPTVNGATTYYAAFSRMKITYPDGSGTGSYTPTTIKPAGTIKKDQQSEEGSPVATINNSVDNLKASVFTAEEREKVAAGEDAKVTLQIKDISTSVSDTDKKLVEEKQINELQSSDQQNSATQNTAPTVLYVDISLLKQIGSGQVIKVTETSSMISISIEVPQSLWNTDNNNSRTYRVVRVHDSAVDILEGTYDPTTHLFTFETDRFSTYALTYQDESRATPENSAGTTVKPTAYQDFNHLRLTAKATKTSQKLTYAKVSKADGYLIYGAQCGQEMKKLADVESTITSYTVNKLKQGTNYKYQVKAYQLIDGKQVIIMTSNVIHSVTEGKIYANPTKVTSNTATVKLAEGKSKTVSCQVVIPKGKKLKQHTAEIRYESSNKKIATVNSNGKITAKAEGTCYVYAYAQNGVYKKIKVVVK